jgi:osomolarity two-component system, sensor histidine kinase SLN1
MTTIPSGSEQPEAEVHAPANNNIKVLVVEDNKVNQEEILRMLKLERVPGKYITNTNSSRADTRDRHKGRSRWARSTRHGPRFDEHNRQAIWSRLHGYTNAKSRRYSIHQLIRELGFCAPIIALTAFADESNRRACMEVGMNGFLPKPIKRNALKQILQEFVAKVE